MKKYLLTIVFLFCLLGNNAAICQIEYKLSLESSSWTNETQDYVNINLNLLFIPTGTEYSWDGDISNFYLQVNHAKTKEVSSYHKIIQDDKITIATLTFEVLKSDRYLTLQIPEKYGKRDVEVSKGFYASQKQSPKKNESFITKIFEFGGIKGNLIGSLNTVGSANSQFFWGGDMALMPVFYSFNKKGKEINLFLDFSGSFTGISTFRNFNKYVNISDSKYKNLSPDSSFFYNISGGAGIGIRYNLGTINPILKVDYGFITLKLADLRLYNYDTGQSLYNFTYTTPLWKIEAGLQIFKNLYIGYSYCFYEIKNSPVDFFNKQYSNQALHLGIIQF